MAREGRADKLSRAPPQGSTGARLWGQIVEVFRAGHNHVWKLVHCIEENMNILRCLGTYFITTHHFKASVRDQRATMDHGPWTMETPDNRRSRAAILIDRLHAFWGPNSLLPSGHLVAPCLAIASVRALCRAPCLLRSVAALN